MLALLESLVTETGLTKTTITDIAIRNFAAQFRAGTLVMPPPAPPVTERTTG